MGSRRANEGPTKGQIRVIWVLFLETFEKSLSQNVNVVGYRIKLSREYQPVGRMEGHFGQTFGLLLDTRNFRFGRFESADLEQARIFKVVKRTDFKEDWFSKNYKCITPKRNYAYRVDITSRVVSYPGLMSQVTWSIMWFDTIKNLNSFATNKIPQMDSKYGYCPIYLGGHYGKWYE